MDVLSDILRSVHLSGAILGRAVFTSPWGVSSEGLASPMFHIVLSGTGFITLDGEEAVPLGPGDLIMMPHGHVHRLQSDVSVPTVTFTSLMAGNPPRKPVTRLKSVATSSRAIPEFPCRRLLCG